MTATIEPKFKVGDRVLHKRSCKIYTVLDSKHHKAIATHAIKVHTDGTTSTSPTTIAEHWTYKLDDGRSWRYGESLLESIAYW
ncbi:hypothetical protein LC605_27780 [Nostoc sp. CHAB 5836]|uniref:hypothetical protein n=1 Tax=Nostoc sp. CHAB 5836 TaxID=2780404 RepID=UPI001E2AAF02|nr:hypothetical protein [Nostoc sp. CHAB 5836]MCC5618820.1 hypothetical protein [Nostoc sp. CHAB 5836]